MGSNIDQNQTVNVMSEIHGVTVEHECELYTLINERGKRRCYHKVKAILYKGKISHVICEYFEPSNLSCNSDFNDRKRCIFVTYHDE